MKIGRSSVKDCHTCHTSIMPSCHTCHTSHTKTGSGPLLIVKERHTSPPLRLVRAKRHSSSCLTKHVLPNWSPGGIGRRTQRRVIAHFLQVIAAAGTKALDEFRSRRNNVCSIGRKQRPFTESLRPARLRTVCSCAILFPGAAQES